MKCPRCNHEWKLPGPQAGGPEDVIRAREEMQARVEMLQAEAKPNDPAHRHAAAGIPPRDVRWQHPHT